MRSYEPTRLNFKCSKCNSTSCQTSVVSTAGGFLSKVFDVQHNKFTAVTCDRCKYTELYKADSSMLGNIFDLFTN